MATSAMKPSIVFMPRCHGICFSCRWQRGL
jgi:hypothetical protein